jgi:hypothetical protein
MEFFRNLGGTHEEFLYMIKSAPVDHPQVAYVARVFGIRVRGEAPVKPHEKDGGTDPGDSHRDVEPATEKEKPFKKFLIHGRFLVRRAYQTLVELSWALSL